MSTPGPTHRLRGFAAPGAARAAALKAHAMRAIPTVWTPAQARAWGRIAGARSALARAARRLRATSDHESAAS